MKKILKNKRGETILEVVIAVSVLMLIMAPASALYISSTRNIADNRNTLIADTLAEEGIEMSRNMRDTNFLRFSQNSAACWNTKPEHIDLATCHEAGNKIQDGSYALKDDLATFDWTFERMADDPLPDDFNPAPDSPYRLKLDEDSRPECDLAGSPSPPACHAHHVDDTHFYNHDRGTDTNFYREIFIRMTDDTVMEVRSRVFFRSGAQMRAVSRSATLTAATL